MATYSLLDKTLHHLALGSRAAAEMSFDLEKSLYSKDAPDLENNQHVFIAGLARAGTTILMRSLYETEQFFSLTYRDMPFVLAPNMWSRLSGANQKKGQVSERAHGDGIQVDFDSPEALEEVFWRIFSGGDYINKKKLIPCLVNQEIINQFKQYVNLIGQKYQANNSSRYLSKNNNNILRIPAIQKSFPHAVILIPFREPLQQAYSLFKQHQLFYKKHKEEPFSQKYMTWLAHHEFGADHRPFVWSENKIAYQAGYQPDTLNYWLEQWVNAYSYLLEKHGSENKNVFFLSYEQICEKTEAEWRKLTGLLNIEMKNIPNLKLKINEQEKRVDEKLWLQAQEIYASLSELSSAR